MQIRSALAMAIAFSLMSAVQAQQAPGPAVSRKAFELRDLVVDAKVLTPEFQMKRGVQSPRVKNWFSVTADYETAADWTDELEFTFYVLVKNTKHPKSAPPQSLFKQTVSYVNIEKGRHKADVFLHPNTIARYGEVQAVAVQVNMQGLKVAEQGKPDTKERWWEKLPPTDGLLLPRSETPFAAVAYDDFPPQRRAQR